MHIHLMTARTLAVLLLALGSSAARSALPAPTPAKQQADAAAQQHAAVEAAKVKQELAASMDQVAARWRARAAKDGWPTHPPITVDAQAGLSPAASQSTASGQPGGRLGSAAASLPVRSEKSGTAPPSADVKDPSKKGK